MHRMRVDDGEAEALRTAPTEIQGPQLGLNRRSCELLHGYLLLVGENDGALLDAIGGMECELERLVLRVEDSGGVCGWAVRVRDLVDC
jgi:hypothetical protein